MPKQIRGKMPWDKWFWSDWKTEPRLALTSITTRGVWFELLGYMYLCEKDGRQCGGELTLTVTQICAIARCTEAEAGQFIDEALEHGFCDINVTGHAFVTVASRRLKREDRKRLKARKRKQRQREREAAELDVTPEDTGERSEVRVKSTDKPPPKPPSKPRPKAKRFTPPDGTQLKAELPWLDAGAWDAWIAYRRQLGKPLKTMHGVDQQIRFLGQHQDTHVQIIEQSMRNEWQGLFALKTNGSATNGRAQTRGERNAQAARNVVRMLDSARGGERHPGDDSDGQLIEA